MTRRTGRSRFTLILLVLTSVTVLTLDFRGAGVIDGIRDGATTVFGPVRDAADSVFEPVGDTWNGIFGYDELEQENARLRERIDQLEGDRVVNSDAARQLEERNALDGLESVTDIPTLDGRVVSGAISNFDHTIEVNRGSDDGVKEGMPVVTGAGLVGRVVAVTGGRSAVQLLTDPDFELGVRLVTSRDIGLAHGTGEGRPLVVDGGIQPDTEVEVGEQVTTSGTDRSAYPADIPVGEVVSVDPSPGELVQVLRLEPYADLDNLGYVRILLWEPPA
jgi:rod shape-determining protein MreC